MNTNDIVIVAARRTPMGSLLGTLSSLSAPELAAVAHRAVLTDAGLTPDALDEVIMGCVLSAGIGQAPARQSALKAGIPAHVNATTLNKMCGSGMKAIMLGVDSIRAQTSSIILAGGMESMSRAPFLLQNARKGYRLGHQTVSDHLFLDGLEDAYEPGMLMGCFADRTAEHFSFSREAQDAYAKRSMERALHAQKTHAFAAEIVPISLIEKDITTNISQDEGPDAVKLTKLSRLKPAFSKTGTVTPGNSSSIADGAASVLLMRADEATRRGILPLARIVGHSSHAQAPEWFTTAPIGAIEALLKKTGWTRDDVDLFEINEAFAVVAMAAIQTLELSPEKVNIHGGACALGHPIGASGARIVTTLVHALRQQGKKRGIAALCIGGGEATAIAVEIF
jgi:acetyl-CoA C-acetyltransferase